MNDPKEREAWTVAADATLQSVLDNPACPELLARALTGTPSWQSRNETTVDRTLKAASLRPQWLAALLALGAVVTVQGDAHPERRQDRSEGSVEGLIEEVVPLEALLEHKVRGDVTALHIPMGGSSHNSSWGEAHVARTAADEPIVAAFATLRINTGAVEDVRLALTGVWPEPVRLAKVSSALIGGPMSQDWIMALAAAVEQAVDPRGDYRGSAPYRRAMAGVLTRRAVEACAAGLTVGGA